MRDRKLRSRLNGWAIMLSLASLFSCQQNTPADHSVMSGGFAQSVTETGELVAIKSVAIPMPRFDYRYGYEFKLIDMIPNGTQVHKGDTILKIDGTNIQKFILTAKEELEKEHASAKKLEVERKNTMQQLEAQLKTELANFDLRKLSLERARYETPKQQQLKDLEFQKAEIRLNKLKRQIESKPILNSYDQNISQIKIWQKEKELQGAYQALDLMTITSPEEGLFQVGKSMMRYPPVDLKIGESVYQGGLLATIPDVTRMRINSFINESDFTKVRVGSKVIIRLDALPSVAFHGQVTHVSRTCITMDKKKVFKIQVIVDESDIRLKPGMTVSCEYICYESENELFVPNDCLFEENGKSYVFRDEGREPVKIEVETGPSNSNHTVVRGPVKAGQKLFTYEEIKNQENT